MAEELQGDSLQASLTVKDLAQSTAWYTDVLGFAIDRKHERDGNVIAVSLKAGAVQILLTQDDGSRGLSRVKGEGFSLQITTHQSADDLATSITTRGGTLDLDPVTVPWGRRIFRIRDPDGFRFTVSSTHVAAT